MQASDELLTIAELAIGLAGFSGVVVAFSDRGQITGLDWWRFAALLTMSVAAAVVAFVPSILNLVGVAEDQLWRLASLAFLVVGIPIAAVFPRRLIRANLETGVGIPRKALAPVFLSALLNLVIQVCNVLGWPWSPHAGPFVIGLLIWLVIAASAFGLLVLHRPTH